MTFLYDLFGVRYLVLILIVISTACSGTSQTAIAADRVNIEENVIRSGDILEIAFESYPELKQTLIVHPDGTVKFKALGEMKVINLASIELRDILNQKYGELINGPKVSVEIQEATNFTIYLGGDIKRPGVVKFRSSLTVTDGILLAGGLKDKSKDYEVYIFRNRGEEGMKTIKIDLTKKVNTKETREYKLAPYDVIFVMKALETARVYGREI